MIITAGGENLAPVPIEDRIKKELPFLSNVMLIGDKRKYLSCLVTLKVKAECATSLFKSITQFQANKSLILALPSRILTGDKRFICVFLTN